MPRTPDSSLGASRRISEGDSLMDEPHAIQRLCRVMLPVTNGRWTFVNLKCYVHWYDSRSRRRTAREGYYPAG